MSDTIEEGTDRYQAPALDKGLDILELLSDFEKGISQIEIAEALDRTPNEIGRMLDRLVRRGDVMGTSSDRYRMTLKLFGLAHRHPPMCGLVAQAMPRMHRFAHEAALTCPHLPRLGSDAKPAQEAGLAILLGAARDISVAAGGA